VSKVMDAKQPLSKSVAAQPEVAEYLYDATLIQVDTLRGLLAFKVEEVTHRVNYPHVSSFSVGAIGRLRLPNPDREFSFNTYPDQRLRRMPALDQPLDRRWGWRIGERKFTVEAGIIPGRAGKVIRRDTRPLTLEVPSEFDAFCRSRGLTPQQMLETWIADVCMLTNYYGAPREDGYCASGDESHQAAIAYINRAWGSDEPSGKGAARRISKRESVGPDE
jgi:hypothetical protein